MIKITNLELENIKRIKAIQLTPSESGLTVIGGNNGQGKTSRCRGFPSRTASLPTTVRGGTA